MLCAAAKGPAPINALPFSSVELLDGPIINGGIALELIHIFSTTQMRSQAPLSRVQVQG